MNPHPADFRQGVDQRLDATLRACGVPPDGVEPLSWQQAPPSPIPDPPGSRRLRHAVRLRGVPPGTDLLAVAADLWRRAGCQVSEAHTAQGRTLVGYDPEGYLLTLTPGGDHAPATLAVASPPTAARRDQGLAIGITVGALLGPAAPCLSLVALSGVFTSVEASPFLPWAWLPLLLIIGGLLVVSPRSRRLGIGLMIGAAATGIATSGLCTALVA